MQHCSAFKTNMITFSNNGFYPVEIPTDGWRGCSRFLTSLMLFRGGGGGICLSEEGFWEAFWTVEGVGGEVPLRS